MQRLLAWLWLIAGPVSGQSTESPGSLVPGTVASAVSQSGQFTVLGGTPSLRRDFANRCEALSRDVSAVTGQPMRAWLHPYIVQLTVADQPQVVRQRANGRVFPLDTGGFRFQLDLLLDGEMRIDEFEGELVKLLLLERMFDPNRADLPSEVIPGWIRSGVEELIAYRRAGRPADIFDALIDSRQVPPVNEILGAETASFLDSVSRSIYRACSAALVQALLEQGGGPARFQALLEDLAYSGSPVPDLIQVHFPALDQDPESLAKWWALQLAAMSEKSAFEFLSMAETERLLEQYLQVDLTVISAEMLAGAKRVEPGHGERRLKFPDWVRWPGGHAKEETDFTSGTIRDFERFLHDPRAPLALQLCQNRLRQLSSRAFPLFRPVLQEYEELLVHLMQGDAKDVASGLSDLDGRRARLINRMSEVSDYMNWFVTTQVKGPSDDFTGYSQALDNLEKLGARKRQDPVTRYLDAMERELATGP